MKILAVFLSLFISIPGFECFSLAKKKVSSLGLQKMILIISYPGKETSIELRDTSLSEKSLQLIFDGKIKKSRKLNDKDLRWLSEILMTFKAEKRFPSSNCEIGEINLNFVLGIKDIQIKRCISAKDETTVRIIKMANVLNMYL